jgi:dTDP-4-amino-4,6-dideoxygalactose transaminase
MTATATNVPLFSLKGQNAEVGEEVSQAVARVLASGAFILGPENAAFDAEFAAALGARYSLGVDSGTSALELALEACGVGPGDEVVVPSFTFVATADAASVLGAKAVFADVDPDTLTLDPKSFARAITKKTKAVVPVHLFGQPADMTAILETARAAGVKVVEDCAQSHLATHEGKATGSLGDVGCFSFYPTKNLGAAGDAGAVTTNSDELRDALLELRNCGRAPGKSYHHVRVGHNARLDELQAAVLRVKLRRLKAWTAARRAVAARYNEAFAGLPLRLPPLGAGGTQPVFCLYVLRCDRRDALAEHLKRHGIGSAVYYPAPVHQQPAYIRKGGASMPLPVSEKASTEVLALPMFPDLSESDQARVIDAVRGFFKA